MNYDYGLTIPVSTGAADPLEMTVKLTPGILAGMSFGYPAGCEGLVGLRILHGLFQVYPLNTNEWLRGDDHTFQQPINYPLRAGETRLRILAYNTDAVNTHTLSIGFSIEPHDDPTTKHLGIVTAELPDKVVADIALLGEMYKFFIEYREFMDDRMIPLMESIWERLTPDLSSRLAGMSLEELSRL